MAREYAPEEPVTKKREFAPEVSSPKKEPGFGANLYAGAYGLGTSALGGLGDIESMVTPESTDPKMRGAETIFPTTENVRTGLSKIGVPKPVAGTEASQFLGEIAPAIAGGAQLAKTGIQKGSVLASRLYGKAFSKDSEKLAEALKAQRLADITKPYAQTEKELGETQKVLGQMAEKPSVAASRVQAVTAGPQAAEREAVREKLGAKVSKEDLAQRQAQQRVDMAQKELQQSQAAVDQLEMSLSGRAGVSADELGRSLQGATAKLAKDGIAARKNAAGYDKVFANAGDKLSVDTTGFLASVNKLYDVTRNPTLQNILTELKTLGASGKGVSQEGKYVVDKALSLRSADSLKGYLDSIISSKQHKDTKLDRETLQSIRNLKNQLMMKITSSHPDYKEAVNRFREMSRPLDIVERNGSLKKVIDKDPVSTAYRMTEAEVTGHVIRKANAGNPAFSRLLETKPELQDSARLYFTKELFGKEAAPTVKSFEKFLIDNERSLRQTGLYDEFKTLNSAQKSARDAVNQAKGISEIAEQRLSSVAQQKESTEALAKKASQRLQESLKTAETPQQLAARLEKAKTTPAPGQAKFASQAERQQKTLDALSELKSNLGRATKPDQVKAEVKATAEKMKDLGLINEQQRNAMLQEVANLGESIEAKQEALKRVRNLVIGLSATAGVGFGGRAIERSFQ